MTLMTPKPPWPQCAPLASAIDLGTGCHPDDARDPQLGEESQPGHVSTTPLGRHEDAALAHGLGHTAHGTADDRQFVALHASFSHGGMRGTPVQRDSATASHEGDHPQRLVCFHGPVHGQSHLAVRGSRRQGL
jgi:hypothetical protein